MKLITEDLIESIKDRSFVPVSQQTFTEERILSLVNQEFMTKMIPLIQSIKEDFFLSSERVSVTSGVSRYAVPERATGNALKAVILVDSNGTRIGPLAKLQVNSLPGGDNTGTPSGFYVVGDEIALYPTPGASFSLEMWYFERVNDLVLTTSCAKITAINESSPNVTFTVDTDQTASWTTATKVDILSAKSPFRLWAKDVTIGAITSSSITVTIASVDTESGAVGPEVGDYICLAQTANYPMIPSEMHPVLAQMCAVRILRSIGDMNRTRDAESELQSMAASTVKLISNRIEGSPDLIVNNYSFLSAQSGIGSGFR